MRFFLFFFLFSCHCYARNLNKFQRVKNPDRIDYIILRQIWPESTCLFPGAHSCSISNDISTWVVHGLWPSENGRIGPSFCNKSLPFDFSKLKPIEAELLKYWPNLYTDTAMDSFWEHEWTKHGTCALSLDNIKDEFDYFNVSLNLRKMYDFGPILAEQSIVPNDTMLYDVKKIKEVVKNKLNVEPLLVCYTKRDSDVQYLSQMQICLDKNYKLTECSVESVGLAGIMFNNEPEEVPCVDDLPISYPTIKPQSVWVDEKTMFDFFGL